MEQKLTPFSKTMTSILFKPPLPVKDNYFETIDVNNYIGKITKETDIDNEIFIYHELSKLSMENPPFLNPSLISKHELTDEIIETLYKSRLFDTFFHHQYEIVFPFVTYPDLHNYLFTEFEINSDYLSSFIGDITITEPKRIMSILNFKHIFTALYNLYQNILIINNDGIYHYDIKPNNIMYNLESNEMILSDWGLSKKDSSTAINVVDITSYLYKVILIFLYLSSSNLTIFNKIKTYIESIEIYHNKSHDLNREFINNTMQELNALNFNDEIDAPNNNKIKFPLKKRVISYEESMMLAKEMIIKKAGSKQTKTRRTKTRRTKTRRTKTRRIKTRRHKI